MSIQSITLNDGTQHPLVGFGTYKVGFVPASASSTDKPAADADPKQVIKDALSVGYRYFDLAQFYGNEDMIGEALKESGVPREELFLASKVWTTQIYEGPDAVRKQVEKSLKDLQTDYLDMYLVHWPVPGKHVAAYQTLEALKEEGKLRTIGLSNYTIEDYEELKPHMKIKPVINQIEVNPFLYRKNTIDYFQREGIAIQSYRALRQAKELDNAVVSQLATKYGRSSAQILGRWCVQKGIVVIAKTVNIGRMVENKSLFDFELSAEDSALLDVLTTPESLATFKDLYDKCICRDTPIQESREGARDKYTVD